MVFSDGRNYWEYEGDTKYVTETIMAADAIIIGTPVFQASIPAHLKNIFDLLPVNAFRDKVVSMRRNSWYGKALLDGRATVKTDISLYEGSYCSDLCIY